MPNETTSWTEISCYRQCPHKHWLQYVERWKPEKYNRPLTTGVAWHEILDAHYRGIKDDGIPNTQKIIDILNQFGAKDPQHPQHDIGDVLLWMYHGYRDWVGHKTLGADSGWTIVEVEVDFEVPLPNSSIRLIGRIDLVVKYKGHYWVIDHKAVRNLPKGKELDLDDQTPLYIWAMRQHGYPVRGAILSHCRTWKLKRPMFPEERYSRDWMYRTDQEIDTVVREATASIESARSDQNQHQRHPDPQSCKWRCGYLEPCIGGRKEPHLEVELLKGLGFRQSVSSRHPSLIPAGLHIVKDA